FVTRWRSPSTLLAGRRLRDDPKAAFRASAGVVLAVFAGSMALAMFPSVDEQIGHSTGLWKDGVYLASSSAVTDQQIADLRADFQRGGLTAPIAPVVEGELGTARQPSQISAMVMKCMDATSVLGANFTGCRPGPAVYVPRDRAVDVTQLGFTGSGEKPIP